MAFGFRRADLPEPSPKPFRGLGPAPGYTVKRFDTEEALDTYLRQNRVEANDAYNAKRFLGGVIPSKREIALMRQGYFDPTKEFEIDDHEFTHSWGPEHIKGKDWALDGRRVAEMQQAEIDAHIEAVRKANAPTFNWGDAFAKAATPTETAATVPMKGAR